MASEAPPLPNDAGAEGNDDSSSVSRFKFNSWHSFCYNRGALRLDLALTVFDPKPNNKSRGRAGAWSRPVDGEQLRPQAAPEEGEEEEEKG